MPRILRRSVSASAQRLRSERTVIRWGRSTRRNEPSELRALAAADISLDLLRFQAEGGQPFEGDGGIAGVELHPIADAAELMCGDQSSTAAAEGIVDDIA